MATDHDSVEYREIPGHPGYRVGSDGSVWSRWESASRGKGKGLGFLRVLGVIWRKLALNHARKSGYLRIRLGGPDYHYVHRLVLESFAGPAPDGTECCHNDGDPRNNRIENLRWGTHTDNVKDMKIHGTNPHGERCHMAKLATNQVREIRARYAAGGVTMGQIAERYGVCRGSVSLIVRRKNWAHVE